MVKFQATLFQNYSQFHIVIQFTLEFTKYILIQTFFTTSKDNSSYYFLSTFFKIPVHTITSTRVSLQYFIHKQQIRNLKLLRLWCQYKNFPLVKALSLEMEKIEMASFRDF